MMPQQHMALRKTLSWAAAAAAEQKGNTFSLFPQTSGVYAPGYVLCVIV